jgi:hypothetical protein
MTDNQARLLYMAIWYLGLCIVRSSVTIAMKPANAQDLINQTLKEYGESRSEYQAVMEYKL